MGCDEIFGADVCSLSLTTIATTIGQAGRDGTQPRTHLVVRVSSGPAG